MRPRHLTAFEHQPIAVAEKGSDVALSPEEANYLAYVGEQRPGFCELGYKCVRLAQYCGIVNLGERVLEILPKLGDRRPAENCRGVLLRMLQQASDVPLFQHIAVGQSLRPGPLLEVFIKAFFDAVRDVVRSGLLRQYQVVEDDLQVVRGRVAAERQFGVNANRVDRVACRFDELMVDNTWNRLIKAGLSGVRPWIGTSELHRRWIELMIIFDEVRLVDVDVESMSRLRFDRQAARYRVVIEWVRWILTLLSPALRAGERSSPGLLFDMNVLFQSAVASLLRQSAWSASGVHVHTQEMGKYLALVQGAGGQRAFAMRPDILVRRKGEILLIADTKWRRLGLGKSKYLLPKAGEAYQIHAYATGFQCDRLLLIYPWYGGLVGARQTSLELPTVGQLQPVVSIVCVDLESQPFKLVYDDATALQGPFLSRETEKDQYKKFAQVGAPS